MEKLTLFILFLCTVFYSSQADRPKFSARVSDEFLYIGKSVKAIVTTTLSEPGPLKYKFKVPFNVSAYMRILAYEMNVNDSLIAITGSKTPNMTSSAGNDNIIDIVTVDLGTVTPTGVVDIVMSFYAQLLDHPQLGNGDDLWMNIGAEFTNSSIWAHQHAIKRFSGIDPAPVLNASLKIKQKEDNDIVVDGTTVDIHIRLTHNPHETTGEVSNAEFVLLHPEYLVYSADAKVDSNSVSVSTKSSSTTSRVLGITALKYLDLVDYKFTFNVDPSKTTAKGKIHKAHIGLQVSFTYSSPFYGSARTGSLKQPVFNSIKFYSKRASCETALGMVDGTITNSMLKASSQSAAGLSSDSRFNSAKAWIPATALKLDGNQFIEVNFQSLKEISRFNLKGNAVSGSYVSLIRVFYSEDCAVYKTYKTKEGKQFLEGNTGPNKVAIVSFEPTIKAKCIRINPRSWHKEIGLRFEVFGCSSSSVPASNLTSRTYLADALTDYIYICSIALIRKGGQPSCYYSKDKCVTWIVIDSDILNINFINPSTKLLYGMGMSNSYFMCPAAPIGKCALISKADYDAAKLVSGVVQAKIADKITVTDDASSKEPVIVDTLDMQNSKKLGASAVGIHYGSVGSWSQKASWVFFDPQ